MAHHFHSQANQQFNPNYHASYPSYNYNQHQQQYQQQQQQQQPNPYTYAPPPPPQPHLSAPFYPQYHANHNYPQYTNHIQHTHPAPRHYNHYPHPHPNSQYHNFDQNRNFGKAHHHFNQPGNMIPPRPVKNIQESAPLFCEPCEKEFKSKQHYDAHCMTHEKCSYAGCEFSGTRKVVSAHFMSQHGKFSGSGFKTIFVEGMKFRVLMGTSPEEVQKWREERKKKFPTSANILQKIEKKKEREMSGALQTEDSVQKRKQKGRNRKRGRVASKDYGSENLENNVNEMSKSKDDLINITNDGSTKKEIEESRNSQNGVVDKSCVREKNNQKKIIKKTGTYQKSLEQTLLKQLLKRDIRREQSITLQCLRLFVQNNFFQKNDLLPETNNNKDNN